jgi:hypothetical protein
VAHAGAGCAGSGGANNYEMRILPWIGSTFRGRSTSIPTPSIVAVVTGLAAMNLPLNSLLPPSPLGCNLLVTPDLVEIATSISGTVDTALPIPNNPTLVGITLFQQLVLAEVGPNLTFVEITSSNSLALTIGMF